jgi:hypothetical protein
MRITHRIMANIIPDEPTLWEFAEMTNTEHKYTTLCIAFGLIQTPESCTCGGSLAKRTPRRDRKIKYFRSTRKQCRKEISTRAGSFFASSHLPIQKILRLLYMWVWHIDGQDF